MFLQTVCSRQRHIYMHQSWDDWVFHAFNSMIQCMMISTHTTWLCNLRNKSHHLRRLHSNPQHGSTKGDKSVNYVLLSLVKQSILIKTETILCTNQQVIPPYKRILLEPFCRALELKTVLLGIQKQLSNSIFLIKQMSQSILTWRK